MKWKKLSNFILAIITIVNIIGSTSVVIAEEPEFVIEGTGTLAIDISGLEDGTYYDENLKSNYTQSDDYTKIKETGNYEVKDGELWIERQAIIDSAPTFINGTPINCSWTVIEDSYVSGENLFNISVKGLEVSVVDGNESLSWNPILLIGGEEVLPLSEEPSILPEDLVNNYYTNNTLEWDYSVCVRRLRVIEGLFSETWVFDKDPEGDIEIQENRVESDGFRDSLIPYAFDANGSSISISTDKVILYEALKDVAYPITIDPTTQFVGSSSDGEINQGCKSTYNEAWTAVSGTADTASLTYSIGQNYMACYYMYRSYVYFNTTALPTYLDISSANVSLKGSYDGSTTDFYVTLQSGMPTYPQDPLQSGDYDKSFYSGNGGEWSTASWSISAYSNISMNATGISWINTNGWTKLCLRSSRDISGTSPSGSEYVDFNGYESGAGSRPYMEVKYTERADITNTPSAKSFGIVGVNTSYWSDGSAPVFPLDDSECYFTVTNNGNQASITINASDFTGGVGWALTNGSPAENTVRLKAGKSGDANEGAMITLNSSPQTFISGLATSATKKWELKLETGTFTDGVIKTCTVQLVATLD